MRGNSKKRLLANLVTAVFALCFFLFCTVTAFAETQISTVKVTASKNSWEQTSNPEVKVDGKGYKVDPSSIKFSSDICDCDPGEDIEVTVKIITEQGYVFKDTLKKNNFKVTNGKYKSHSYEDGNIILKFTYTVRGKTETPDSVYWDGTTARWDKVNDKVNYTLKICKGNRSKIVAENISSNRYDLKKYLILEDYYDEYEVYFNNEKVGIVTSGGVSPSRGDNIGLAYVKNLDNLAVGSTIKILIREKFYNAEVINKPFVKKRNKG